MQDSHNRRAFLKTGAKVAGGVALAKNGSLSPILSRASSTGRK